MRRFLILFGIMALFVPQGCASTLPPCLGGTSVSTFRLILQQEGRSPALPLSSMNIIQSGAKLKYEPVHVPLAIKDKAQIAILLVPVSKLPAGEGSKKKGKDKDKGDENGNELIVLDAHAAKDPAEWVIPQRSSIVGVVFGPHGLDVKKVSTLVEKNENLIPQLADFAQQTATVEALVKMLSEYEESPNSGQDINAALSGFSAQYGVSMSKLDTTAPTDAQANQLIRAVMPSMSAYDPNTSDRSAVIAQSTGLATAVAGLFFGSPVGLAAGGASLFMNLRSMMFPDTDFHAAFVQTTETNGMALCTKSQTAKPRTRPAYLWILRVPDASAPEASLPGPVYLPLGGKSEVKIACANPGQLRILPRAREWQLASTAHTAPVPVTITVGNSDDSFELDLSRTKLPAGQYRLTAMWDWDQVEVKGNVNLRPIASFSEVKATADSQDSLVEGSGPVKIQLAGADFEFVNKVAIVPSGDSKATPKELSFTLPKGPSAGEQTAMEVDVDSSALRAGSYLLKLTQINGSTHDVAITIHPPNPTVSNLPLRVNVGEPQQTVALEGTGLERLEGLVSEGATWELAPPPAGVRNLGERKATLKLAAQVKKDDKLDVNMKVAGHHSPLKIPGALRVAGPRPKIASANASSSQAIYVALRQGEIAAGAAVSFAIRADNAGLHPAIDLSCANASDVKVPLILHPGERNGTAQLDFAGEGVLFLSADPGAVGQSGCQLIATLTVDETGSSDSYTLGRVVRLPHIEQFALGNEKLADNVYSGTLTGQELQTIEKTGWDSKNGVPVQGIPTPVPGTPQDQTLKIGMPWPPPSPRAPIYVWLRGEKEGRLTMTKY